MRRILIVIFVIVLLVASGFVVLAYCYTFALSGGFQRDGYFFGNLHYMTGSLFGQIIEIFVMNIRHDDGMPRVVFHKL